jgi:hypothetical protein
MSPQFPVKPMTKQLQTTSTLRPACHSVTHFHLRFHHYRLSRTGSIQFRGCQFLMSPAVRIVSSNLSCSLLKSNKPAATGPALGPAIHNMKSASSCWARSLQFQVDGDTWQLALNSFATYARNSKSLSLEIVTYNKQ